MDSSAAKGFQALLTEPFCYIYQNNNALTLVVLKHHVSDDVDRYVNDTLYANIDAVLDFYATTSDGASHNMSPFASEVSSYFGFE